MEISQGAAGCMQRKGQKQQTALVLPLNTAHKRLS